MVDRVMAREIASPERSALAKAKAEGWEPIAAAPSSRVARPAMTVVEKVGVTCNGPSRCGQSLATTAGLGAAQVSCARNQRQLCLAILADPAAQMVHSGDYYACIGVASMAFEYENRKGAFEVRLTAKGALLVGWIRAM